MNQDRQPLLTEAHLPTKGLKRVATLRETTRGMPVGEAGLAYFRPGKPRILASKATGRNVVISRMRIEQKFAAYTVPNPAWLVFHIPLNWEEDYHFNGREMRHGQAVIADCPGGYFTKGTNRDALTLGIRKSTLYKSMAALLGGTGESINLVDVVFRPSHSLALAIRSQLDVDEGTTQSHPARDIPELAEKDLLDQLATDLIALSPNLRVNNSGGRRSSDVVAEVLRLCSGRNKRLPSLSELCVATGLGQTRLFECFQEVQGLSPYNYLQQLRLDEAYGRLSDRENPPRSIKDVALELGYSKPGRFARRFRSQFQELPSEVLARTKTEHGLVP